MYNYKQANPFQRALRVSAAWPLMSKFYSRTLHHLDRVVFKATKGKATFASFVTGLPIVMLRTTGAKSGQARDSPLIAIPDGSKLIVIASNYGGKNNPGWCYNLRANPRCAVAFEGTGRAMVARELEGAERAAYYAKGVEIYPGWTPYEKRAAPRHIPVFELTPSQ